MELEMLKTGSQISAVDIVQFENRIGYTLPEMYRDFLLRCNGGRPKPDYSFSVPGWSGKRTVINDFNGIDPGWYMDLEDNIEALRGRLPKGFIPIAEDPGGNYVLLSLNDLTKGRIYFFDHEDEPEESVEDYENFPNVYLLANNFIEFLNQLTVENES